MNRRAALKAGGSGLVGSFLAAAGLKGQTQAAPMPAFRPGVLDAAEAGWDPTKPSGELVQLFHKARRAHYVSRQTPESLRPSIACLKSVKPHCQNLIERSREAAEEEYWSSIRKQFFGEVHEDGPSAFRGIF